MNPLGLHHVTAVTGHAVENVRFYTQVLGMRLVKKTVNQDDVSAYHLFYGDGRGNPGTELTFLDWPRVEKAVPGVGTIGTVGLRVAGTDSLEWWSRRFEEYDVPHTDVLSWCGSTVVGFTDPDGLRLELVDDGGEPGGVPWEKSPVPPQRGIRGLHSATLVMAAQAPTDRVLTRVLGFRQVDGYPLPGGPPHRLLLYQTRAGGPGTRVQVEVRPDLPDGRVGIGGVHHLAFRTPDEAELRGWQVRLARAGLRMTPVIDRYYFRSIYFHEPGGALLEMATDGPGLSTDEDPAHLGERLSLPPFLESERRRIEERLRPLD